MSTVFASSREKIVICPWKVAPHLVCDMRGLLLKANRGFRRAWGQSLSQSLEWEADILEIQRSVKEQRGRGHAFSLRLERRCRRPSSFTSRKQAEIRQINANNRALALEVLSFELAEMGLLIGISKLHNSLRIMGAASVQWRITSTM